MEEKYHNITSKNALKIALLQQTSWRFFLLFTIPPLIWSLAIVSFRLPHIFILLLSFIVWMYCWRLWLDERYFRFINEENNRQAGEILAAIWHRKKLKKLTFTERERGAIKLHHHTLWLTLLLWIVWLIIGMWVT
ncbi:hypothetical protein PT276_05830 [Orbaceae bacterium ESL0721]|nr:hypothetical protein [Orbaceae bacterium ESL0721]